MAEYGAASKLSIQLAVHLGREDSLPGRVEGHGQHLLDGGRSAPCIPWMLISRHVWTLTHPGQRQRWRMSSEMHTLLRIILPCLLLPRRCGTPLHAHGLGSPSEVPVAQGGEAPALGG